MKLGLLLYLFLGRQSSYVEASSWSPVMLYSEHLGQSRALSANNNEYFLHSTRLRLEYNPDGVWVPFFQVGNELLQGEAVSSYSYAYVEPGVRVSIYRRMFEFLVESRFRGYYATGDQGAPTSVWDLRGTFVFNYLYYRGENFFTPGTFFLEAYSETTYTRLDPNVLYHTSFLRNGVRAWSTDDQSFDLLLELRLRGVVLHPVPFSFLVRPGLRYQFRPKADWSLSLFLFKDWTLNRVQAQGVSGLLAIGLDF